MAEICLNCTNPVKENFCPNCGQKTTVHRYSFKHFIEHDLIHGIWHVDKGFLLTIKKLFISPGNFVNDYLQGKRVNYFNVITLLVLILGIGHFLGEYTHIKFADLVSSDENSKKIMNIIEEFSEKYPKLILLIFIPFYSFFSFIWFRKTKFNLTEHFILNSYMTAGTLLISTIFTFITIFYTNISGLKNILILIQISTILYIIIFYYNIFRNSGYKKSSLILRSIFAIISAQSFYILLGILVGYLGLM